MMGPGPQCYIPNLMEIGPLVPEKKIFKVVSFTIYTLQEMCCGFLLSREMWYRKSVLPGTGAGGAELKID